MGTLRFLGAAACIAAAILAGCSGEKVAEKAMETGLRQDGQKANVNIDGDNKTVSITVADADGKQQQVNMNAQGDNMTMNVTDVSGAQQQMSMNVQGESMTMNIAGEDGVMRVQSGAGSSLPANFPKDIPQYPGMQVEAAFDMGESNFSVSATTSDALDKIGEYYRKASADNGWKEMMNMSQSGDQPSLMLQYAKDNRNYMVAATVEDGLARIALTTGMQ